MLWEIELMNNRKVLVTDMETDLDVMNGIWGELFFIQINCPLVTTQLYGSSTSQLTSW
jgi:hypothetical protein